MYSGVNTLAGFSSCGCLQHSVSHCIIVLQNATKR